MQLREKFRRVFYKLSNIKVFGKIYIQFRYPVEGKKIHFLHLWPDCKKNINLVYGCPGFHLSYVSLGHMKGTK